MNPILALFICIFIVSAISFYIRFDTDAAFNEWYSDVHYQATFFGFTPEDVENFIEDEWYEHFVNGLTVEEAIKKHLSK